MYFRLPKVHVFRFFHTNSLSSYSKLIDQCLKLKRPINCAKSVHSQLIKLGFNVTTFLGNRTIDMYGKICLFSDSLKVFEEIYDKNIYSWNICLKVLAQVGDIAKACCMFEEMPERDIVSWNSMISLYASCGFSEKALEFFVDMQKNGVRPSGFTFSIIVLSVKCASVGKEIHCCIFRSGLEISNIVVLNSLIDMYGKLGEVEYALGVFSSMKEVDVISWNSLISGCCSSGVDELALRLFCLMRCSGFAPDEFTVSTMFSACCTLRNLEKGKQILCFCIKMGFFTNTIVSGAAIDCFSKCNRIEDSMYIFGESHFWDSALCNSMISTYARHGLVEKAFELFVLALRENVRPTEVTLSSVLSCAPAFVPLAQGSQVHSLVVKSGFGSDSIVSSSLVDMYVKFGLVDCAMEIFAKVGVKDLIAWNTLIIGLSNNGEVCQSIAHFEELIRRGLRPDGITFSGILLACRYGGLLEEGTAIFTSMQEDYGVKPLDDHYACIIDLMARAGKFEEAIAVLKAMPHAPNANMWESMICACRTYGDQKLAEEVAERMIELKIGSSLSYSVLAQAYEQRARWESLVRIKRLMKQKAEVVDHSWIGLGGSAFTFGANQTFHHGGEDVLLLLRLLSLEMLYEDDDWRSLFWEW